MPFSLSSLSSKWQRQRGSRRIGRILLFVIFGCLMAMYAAAGWVIPPLLGSQAPLYRGALYIAVFWNAMLLSAIWMRHNWARFALAGFLLCFDTGLLLFVSEAVLRYPSLKGEGVNVLVLLSATNALAAAYLLAALDIRWLSRPQSPKDE